jgi:hypothetical protein
LDTLPWADPGAAGGAHPLPVESAFFSAESALFVEECNIQTKIGKGTRSLHKTQHFPQKKTLLFCN